MNRRKRSMLAIRSEAVLRHVMTSTLSGLLPLYVVTEYPKSGGSWLAQMLSASLGVPFPRNRFPALRSSIMHGHYAFSPRLKNVVVMFRDGRDVAVSAYHHFLFENELHNAPLVARVRRQVSFDDYGNVRKNLPAFIEFLFTDNQTPRFNWADFVRDWLDRKAVFVKYEELLEDTPQALSRTLFELTGEAPDPQRMDEVAQRFSFRNQSKRRPGQERKNSFLRKGIAGDWKNHFSAEACRVFCRFAGPELIRLGYERDDTWVKTVSSSGNNPGDI